MPEAKDNFKIPGMNGRNGRNRGEEIEKPKEAKKTVRRLIRYFSEEKKIVLVLLLVVIVTVVCSVYTPKLQSVAIDRITGSVDGNLNNILVIMFLVYMLQCAGSYLQNRYSAVLSQKIVKRMRKELFDHIINLPVRYLDQHSHGDLMSRMTNDVEDISNTISQSLSSLFSGVLTVIGTIIAMLTLSIPMTLLSCITIILTLVVTKSLAKGMRYFYRKKQIYLGQVNGIVEETITSYKTVMAYNYQEEILDNFDDTSDKLTKAGFWGEVLSSFMPPLMTTVNNIGFVIIAAFGGLFALKGTITIGVISAFIIYAKQFGRPIDEIAQIYGQIQTAIAGAERVFSILDEKSEDKSGTNQMENMEGIISFEHVNFSYIPGQQILHDFSLKIKRGHKIALVGATGSGKTTVVNLLMRFYGIDSGSIRIDNVDINEIDCKRLRKNIAIVLQDTVLFADSIENNIRYSKSDATQEEIEMAASISNCREWISRLKDGYQFMLSEAGENLSQGQRQLLSIARAFLAQPKILILDEATSSVDTRTEKHIQDAMTKLMQNKTSLIIAHRLSTIRDADMIVVLDQGKIIETGNHTELLEKHGKYYELYMTQFSGVAT